MRKQPFCCTLLSFLICFSISMKATAQVVNLPDSNLRSAIEAQLDKAPGDTITTADMATLTNLEAPNANITDLTGLEHAINLITLDLGDQQVEQDVWINSNSVSDLSPVAGLANLTTLFLQGNNISDISPLAGLTNLTALSLGNNNITDISPLAGLTNLTELSLQENAISDLSPLTGLNNLTTLFLQENAISDLSPLAGLNNLTELYLRENTISDISPLAGLNNLTTLFLQENAISDISPLAGLTNLTRLSLGDNNITDISPLAGLTNLTELYLHNNTLSDISPLSGFTHLTWLVLSNNSISNLSPLVANTGLGSGDTVRVTGNVLDAASINTHIPTLQSRGVQVRFDSAVEIPDPNLRAVLEEALDKSSGDTITVDDMAALIILSAPNADITNLTGLEHAINLITLSLGDQRVEQGVWTNSNSVSDLSPLVGLTNLTTLFLQRNNISDVSSLARLTNLTRLSLGNNNITNISPLAGLTNLTQLFLQRNAISDISPLTGLTNLTKLYLQENAISDISPLAGLTNLTELYLQRNAISDISPLLANPGLTSGDTVDVGRNVLDAASINTHLPTLQTRRVQVRFDSVTVETVDPAQPVEIPDPNLRAVLEEAFDKSSGDTITVADMQELSQLEAANANITDLTGLEYATNLIALDLGVETVVGTLINSNSVSDISPLAGLNNLTQLWLERNNITDLAPLARLNNLTHLVLWNNFITDLAPLAGLSALTRLDLYYNLISDISPLAGLTNLTVLQAHSNFIADISPLDGLNNLLVLWLDGNNISDISPLTGLTRLKALGLAQNAISDTSSLTGLTELIRLDLDNNAISDILPLTGLTNLVNLDLGDNAISDISPLTGLTNLMDLYLANNSISDISPLVENTGLGLGDTVGVTENPLDTASINTHLPTLQRRKIKIHFRGLTLRGIEYTLSIPAGISLIHVPLRVTAVDGIAQTLESVSDLYDALGGEGNVIYLFTRDSQTQEWVGYLKPSDRGTSVDRQLTDDMGIITNLITPAPLRLRGNSLGTDGNSTITLNPGINLVGVPLRDSRITHVSDLFVLEGTVDNVLVIMAQDNNGVFKQINPTSSADIAITGGQSFIMTALQEATVDISGEAWTNAPEAAAPLMAMRGIKLDNVTPILGLTGSIVTDGTRGNQVGIRVTAKNLSTGREVTATLNDALDYRLAVVDIEAGRAAQIGDILEISAQSPNPFIGIEPLRYTITTEDVKQSLIQLPELVAYEIPAETELLANYPNPFNPETWIPYRLAEDAFVTLTIYDGAGQVVRTLDVGHQVAAVYENRSKAVYWDGRNEFGEGVASGVYFYHLSAGEYSATRKMVILK